MPFIAGGLIALSSGCLIGISPPEFGQMVSASPPGLGGEVRRSLVQPLLRRTPIRIAGLPTPAAGVRFQRRRELSMAAVISPASRRRHRMRCRRRRLGGPAMAVRRSVVDPARLARSAAASTEPGGRRQRPARGFGIREKTPMPGARPEGRLRLISARPTIRPVQSPQHPPRRRVPPRTGPLPAFATTPPTRRTRDHPHHAHGQHHRRRQRQRHRPSGFARRHGGRRNRTIDRRFRRRQDMRDPAKPAARPRGFPDTRRTDLVEFVAWIVHDVRLPNPAAGGPARSASGS